METNRIKNGERVKVLIYNEEEMMVFSTEFTDVNTVSEAVERAYADSALPDDIRDFVFSVVDMSTGTEASYRVNAGGNVVLI